MKDKSLISRVYHEGDPNEPNSQEELSSRINALHELTVLHEDWGEAFYLSMDKWRSYDNLKKNSVKWEELQKQGPNKWGQLLEEWSLEVDELFKAWSESRDVLYKAREIALNASKGAFDTAGEVDKEI